jgi:hypothetical protein
MKEFYPTTHKINLYFPISRLLFVLTITTLLYIYLALSSSKLNNLSIVVPLELENFSLNTAGCSVSSSFAIENNDCVKIFFASALFKPCFTAPSNILLNVTDSNAPLAPASTPTNIEEIWYNRLDFAQLEKDPICYFFVFLWYIYGFDNGH